MRVRSWRAARRDEVASSGARGPGTSPSARRASRRQSGLSVKRPDMQSVRTCAQVVPLVPDVQHVMNHYIRWVPCGLARALSWSSWKFKLIAVQLSKLFVVRHLRDRPSSQHFCKSFAAKKLCSDDRTVQFQSRPTCPLARPLPRAPQTWPVQASSSAKCRARRCAARSGRGSTPPPARSQTLPASCERPSRTVG